MEDEAQGKKQYKLKTSERREAKKNITKSWYVMEKVTAEHGEINWRKAEKRGAKRESFSR